METWIIRFVALFCAAGSAGLLWIFGAFVVVPWRAGRMLALSSGEMQLLGASLLIGAAVGWGALHLLALGDKKNHPGLYRAFRGLLIVLLAMAILSGIAWTPVQG